MKKYVFIGIGGFFGAILRYYIKNIHIYNYHETMPLNTLMINISGSFLIGLFLTIAFEIWEMDEEIRLGIATGFLGAFTTFSTICKETAEMLNKGYYYSSLSYLTVTVVLGLSATYFGIVLAREVIKKAFNENFEIEDAAE